MPKAVTFSALAVLAFLASGIATAQTPPGNHRLIAPQPHSGLPPGIAHRMPPRGFRDAPPSLRSVPRRAPPPVRWKGGEVRRPVGRPGHDLGLFHGRDFAHLSPVELKTWRGGHWRYAFHRGHRGWWWIVDEIWLFYPAPIYPYPLYIGTLDYYDYYDWYGAPDYYWYLCTDPEGYYPYVQECVGRWHAVPPAPEK